MSERDSLILAHLRELRADMNARFDPVDGRLAAADGRLDRIEAANLKFMRTFVGHRSMTERTFASFELQFEQIEARLTKPERAGA